MSRALLSGIYRPRHHCEQTSSFFYSIYQYIRIVVCPHGLKLHANTITNERLASCICKRTTKRNPKLVLRTITLTCVESNHLPCKTNVSCNINFENSTTKRHFRSLLLSADVCGHSRGSVSTTRWLRTVSSKFEPVRHLHRK